MKSFSATFSGLPADSSLVSMVSISSPENGWMSSGLKLKRKLESVGKLTFRAQEKPSRLQDDISTSDKKDAFYCYRCIG